MKKSNTEIAEIDLSAIVAKDEKGKKIEKKNTKTLGKKSKKRKI